ncbi:hypothetical protein BPLS_P5635 [Bathymodiolus platifrons methanotrophic gill symbiont]|nr:hypothetical protein BMR10_09225 [Methylococcaceae bacterium CS4]TXL09425.1 hypothetical protein BMR08_13380 [Methylococcaceae bacterium CS2]GFO77280.1 hypothetical protein BPLS_P5635 [Bathymodiolus platifrons methanotrophic gill symbiont]
MKRAGFAIEHKFIVFETETEIGRPQARHATSQHSGTPVTNIHSPTQRMGDALVALRPSQLRAKPCSVKAPTHGLTAIRNAILCLPRALLAHFGLANCPVAYHGLKIITSLWLRFPDFQRMKFIYVVLAIAVLSLFGCTSSPRNEVIINDQTASFGVCALTEPEVVASSNVHIVIRYLDKHRKTAVGLAERWCSERGLQASEEITSCAGCCKMGVNCR